MMMDPIEITDDQRDRFERIKDECDGDGHLLPPDDRMMMKGLMDTWDAASEGFYTDMEPYPDDTDAVAPAPDPFYVGLVWGVILTLVIRGVVRRVR